VAHAPDSHPVLLHEARFDRGRERLRRRLQLAAKPLGHLLEHRQVVVAAVDEIVDLALRRCRGGGVLRAVQQRDHRARAGAEPIRLLGDDAAEAFAFGRLQVGILLQDLREGADRADLGQYRMAQLHQRRVLAQPVGERERRLAGVPVAPIELQHGVRPVRAL
jgi:hypothetical protein